MKPLILRVATVTNQVMSVVPLGILQAKLLSPYRVTVLVNPHEGTLDPELSPLNQPKAVM